MEQMVAGEVDKVVEVAKKAKKKIVALAKTKPRTLDDLLPALKKDVHWDSGDRKCYRQILTKKFVDCRRNANYIYRPRSYLKTKPDYYNVRKIMSLRSACWSKAATKETCQGLIDYLARKLSNTPQFGIRGKYKDKDTPAYTRLSQSLIDANKAVKVLSLRFVN